MDTDAFEVIVDNRCRLIKSVLKSKAEEYATEDRFHNFVVAGRKGNVTPEEALIGMKLKHDVAVDDLVRWAKEEPKRLNVGIIEEKIGDSINYLVLLEGMLKEIL